MRRVARSGRTLLIVVAVVLLVAATVGVWFWMSTPARPAVDAGKAVGDAFLGAVRDGKPDDAWQSTTAEFKSAEGKETFRRRAKATPNFKLPLVFVSTQTVAVGDQPREEYLYQAPRDGKMATVRLLIGQEGGEWKVDRVTAD